jgi:hypothetical protein
LDAKLAAFENTIANQKNQIVTVLEAHITAHNQAAAAHAAEVSAAQAVIAKAFPGSTPKATEAAAFILTSGSSGLQGAINFFGRNWRYMILVAGVGLIIVGKYVWHVI